MRTRQQARVENHEEGEEEIVYDVREEGDVDDLFRGYSEGTKIIVVALKSARKGFFLRDERRRDGGLISERRV